MLTLVLLTISFVCFSPWKQERLLSSQPAWWLLTVLMLSKEDEQTPQARDGVSQPGVRHGLLSQQGLRPGFTAQEKLWPGSGVEVHVPPASIGTALLKSLLNFPIRGICPLASFCL